MHPTLTSLQNEKIKNLIALQKSRERKKHKLFSIEGIKELVYALEAGYILNQVFYCPVIISEDELCSKGIPSKSLVPVTVQVFEKIAYRKTTGGVVAIAKWKTHTLETISLQKNPLLLIIKSIEKPGNIGALLRTADAAGIDAVIICEAHTDIYNPNVIRSSMGCLFTKQVVSTTSQEAIAWIKSNKIKIYGTSLQGTTPHWQVNYKIPCAIVMGEESAGLNNTWKENADKNIIIPMHGKIDSLNVSVTAGIVLFEALRQREI